MTDKATDGTVLFDINEARNSTLKLCHNYEEDLDTLDISLRAGNFRAYSFREHRKSGQQRSPSAALRRRKRLSRFANTAMDNDVTPVYLAAQEGHLAVLKYLIVERGVDPNARDGDGATPLHFAASRGHLSTVRWLLRHGARLHLDRHGKSPINDAAENHHLECLNVLVAAGASGDNKQLASYKTVHSCSCAPGEARCALPTCINVNTRSPFFLHGPERRVSTERRGSVSSTVGSISSARSGPADGLYVNPMQRTANTQHCSSGEESSACSASDPDSAARGWFLHGSNNTSGAPAALYQRVRDLFHTRSPGPRVPAEGQEAPIMTVKAEIHGNKEVPATQETQEHTDSDSGAEANRRDHHYEDIYLAREEQQRRSAALVIKQELRGSASRLSSGGSRRPSVSDEIIITASASSGVSSGGSSGDEAPPPPPLPPPPASDDERPRGPNLVNKHPALPFVPPAFPHNAPDSLIKPSEYLKTITAPCKRDDAAEARPPPPPAPEPIPPPPPQPPLVHQPLAAISTAELTSVRLKTTATKTLSAPARSVSLQCLSTAVDFKAAKTDLIEELKLSKDITGIRKLKVERARRESLQDKETFTEFTKRFTADSFVDQGYSQIPERDASGNVIPAWKRQMLARRAAEKAKRDLERELAGEAERRRAAAVPAWKRQLLARREEAESRLRQSLYTPKVEETNGEWRAYPGGGRAVSIDNITLCYDSPATPARAPSELKLSTEQCNGNSKGHITNGKHEEEEERAKIIPWRAQLRKTNSKLNLLE
ncbi:unnamed protein product [Leptidea sinapis]|uniref:Uncharacterized protein n=1 Tax=Leptidea sinapis TaxID=189913 RepID=A0A5E4QVN7_9NEOP|nr:unnamed protein product [Leptidea sinapis]